MEKHIRLLSLTVGTTLILLALAGFLIVVGIFNETLNWDIFGPRVEAVLWGVFSSSIALACVGVAMTIVMGTQEIVKAFRSIQHERSRVPAEERAEAPNAVYARYVLFAVLFLAGTIALLSLINHGVQIHRSKVFKRIVSEQMMQFQPKLAQLLGEITEPPRENVPRELYDLVRTLDGLSFIRKTTLYLPDPEDRSALWNYSVRMEYTYNDGFRRFFAARDYEHAIVDGFRGNAESLDKLNEETGFTFEKLAKETEV